MQIEANVTESKTADVVVLTATMDREAALVLAAVLGNIVGEPNGPRGVTDVLFSQLSNTLQWHRSEGVSVHADCNPKTVRLVDSSADMLRNLAANYLTLWTNKDNPHEDSVAID